MDRTAFLQLSHKVSQLEDGVQGIKKSVPAHLLVSYQQTSYYPVGYEMKFKQGTVLHHAILHDLHAKSVVYAPLDQVQGVDPT